MRLPRAAFAATLLATCLSVSHAADRLELTSPRAGEVWTAESLHMLTWRCPATITAVEVRYATDDNRAWQPLALADGAPATGVATTPGPNRLLWRVPATTARRCRIQIRSMGGEPVAQDTSKSFEIAPRPEGTGYEWQCLTTAAAFAGRDGAGALSFAGKMWLLGGWNPGDKVNFPKVCNSEVWSSTDGATWNRETLQAPWEGRHTAGYAVHRDRMWIVGGDCIQGHYQNDVWSSADGVNWQQVTNHVSWGPRVLHCTYVFNDRIWVLGGQTLPPFAPGNEVFYSDVWSSPDGAEWTKMADNCPWGPRGMIGGQAVFNGRMWILGGGTYDTPKIPSRQFYNDVWSSADGVNWERHVEFAPWEPRQYHDVAVWDGKLWVMEGYCEKGGNRRDVWYSADGTNWYEVPDTPWAPRHAASLFTYGDALWMVAGNNMFPDAWKLVRR